MRSGPPRLLNILVLAAVFAGFCVDLTVAADAVELFVAPDGRDDAPGTQSQPFGTIQRARDALRALRKTQPMPSGPITVWLRGGDYIVNESIRLTNEDSGAVESPVCYSAWPGEAVRLLGGALLPAEWFEPVADNAVRDCLPVAAREHVMQVDLGKRGIRDCGKLQSMPTYQAFGMTSEAELFFKDEPMTLSRWPNGDFARATVHGSALGYEGDRPERWRRAEEIWVGGYLDQDWLFRVARIASFDLENRRILLPPDAGITLKTDGPARRFFCYNVLEELDRPGEYFIDRGKGLLYFYPPGPMESEQAVLSLLAQPLFAMENASHLSVRGLVLTVSRGNGVEIRGGESVSIERCTMRNLGGGGVLVLGGRNHAVRACEIAHVGAAGISATGGDPNTLSPCGHILSDNHIHHFGRRKRTYAPGIQVCDAVGSRIAHNHIHDAPHSAILLNGNDNVVECNEIHHVVQEANDAGAISSGGGWQFRGNAIVHNFVHHVHGVEGHVIKAPGVYLDTVASGVTVAGNVFYQDDVGVFVHSGRDNMVENNVIVDCGVSVKVLDSSKQRWHNETMSRYCRPGIIKHHDNPDYGKYPHFAEMWQELPAVPVSTTGISREDYEKRLAAYLDEHLDVGAVWEVPKFNAIRGNFVVGSPDLSIDQVARESGVVEANLVLDAGTAPGFADAARMNFAITSSSPAFQKIPRIQSIPFAEIGPRGPVGAGSDLGGTSKSGAVDLVHVRLPSPHDPVCEKVLAIFTRQVTERCNARVTTTEASPLTVEFAVESGIGADGYSIVDGANGTIRIVGNDGRGLLYGAGKFLRSSRYDRNGFTPGTWRGTSSPKCPVRGVYLATHFGNFYEAASAEEIQRYLEDLSLWGLNIVAVHFPAWQFQGFDDPAARKNIERLRLILKSAKSLGLQTALLEAWNGGFGSAPKEIWAVDFKDWHGGGFAGRNVCPANLAGHAYLSELNSRLLDEFLDIGIDGIVHWPYDEGGCGCQQCRPWGARGYVDLSREVSLLARAKFPGCKSILSTWCYGYPANTWMFDPANVEEWEGLAKSLSQDKSWVDYVMADAHEDFPPYPLRQGVPGGLPLLNFPEISMWEQTPWGGYGANPFSNRLQRLWNQTGGRLSGGLPYSEGVYDDLNKVTCLQLYWQPDRPTSETIREYAAYEYSPEVADEVLSATEIIEKNHLREQIDRSAIQAYRLLSAADAKLTREARNAWRWQLLYLRAAMDQEMYRNRQGQATQAVFDRVASELAAIYHVRNEPSAVIRPARIRSGQE